MLRAAVHFSLWFASKILAFFHFPILLYYMMKKRQKCIPVNNEIYYTPAVILADKIIKKELRSAYVVDIYITRAKEVNSVLNAIVEDRFEKALEEAMQVDNYLDSTDESMEEIKEKYPLLGVPLTVKEPIAVAGLSYNSGRNYPADDKASSDATCVKQLKSQGAIVILVSNTPELCLSWECYNLRTGRTLNPYDTRRTSGGSSGGEAALLASCGSILGIGSDLVGSLRIPSLFCGVFSHKPTPGLVSTEGHFALWAGEDVGFWKTALTIGPMTRFACDLSYLFDAMLRPETKHLVNNEVNLENIKVYYMFGHGNSAITNKVDVEIITAIKVVARDLHKQGVFVKELDGVEGLEDAVDLSFIPLLSLDSTDACTIDNKSSIFETIRFLLLCATITPSAILLIWLKNLFKCFASEERIQKNFELLQKLGEYLSELLGNDAVLLYPGFTNVANYHGQIFSKTMDTSYLAIFSNLGFPVTVCPIYLNSEGMPISLQIIAKPYNDKLCLALARKLEINHGGWAPAPCETVQNKI